MKIKIRQHDASVPQADGWSQMGDWLAELGDDNHTKPPGDGHAEPDGTDDPRPEALAQADAQAALTMLSQVPGKRHLIERRRSGWAASSKRHSPPCNGPAAACGADRGELIYERRAIRVFGTPGSS